MPVPPTTRCPDPSGHTAFIASKAYDDLDRLADRVAFLAAHDLGYAREVADDLADGLRTLVNRLEAEPPRLFGYDPCDDPDLGDGYYAQQQHAARRAARHGLTPDSTTSTERDRGPSAPPAATADEPTGFAVTDAAARLLDDHHAARVDVPHIPGRAGRGRPIR